MIISAILTFICVFSMIIAISLSAGIIPKSSRKPISVFTYARIYRKGENQEVTKYIEGKSIEDIDKKLLEFKNMGYRVPNIKDLHIIEIMR